MRFFPRTIEKAVVSSTVSLADIKRFQIVSNANSFFWSSNSNRFLFNWKLKNQAGFEISTNDEHTFHLWIEIPSRNIHLRFLHIC